MALDEDVVVVSSEVCNTRWFEDCHETNWLQESRDIYHRACGTSELCLADSDDAESVGTL